MAAPCEGYEGRLSLVIKKKCSLLKTGRPSGFKELILALSGICLSNISLYPFTHLWPTKFCGSATTDGKEKITLLILIQFN